MGYWLQGLTGELMSLAFLSNERTRALTLAGYLFWPPFVHFLHDQPRAALGSLALRVGLPLVTMAAISATGCCKPNQENEFAAAPLALSGLIATAVAVGVDAKFSRAPASAPGGPVRFGIMGGVLAGNEHRGMPAVTAVLETDSPSTPATYSLQVTGAFGDQRAYGGETISVQSGAARLLMGGRIVEGRRAFLAASLLGGVRSIVSDYDDEIGVEVGGALSFRARFSEHLFASAGLLGYHLSGSGVMGKLIAEVQAGVGWYMR